MGHTGVFPPYPMSTLSCPENFTSWLYDLSHVGEGVTRRGEPIRALAGLRLPVFPA